MEIPGHIFKAYDIRGLVDSELSEDLAYRIGRAFVVFIEKKGIAASDQHVAVGFDMRPSSTTFFNAVVKGITDQGAHAVDIGFVSTPVFNFACEHYTEHAGGIMITASHNPAEYNGFKLTMGDGLPVGANTGMDEIRDAVIAGAFEKAHETGTVIQKDVFTDYYNRIFSLIDKVSIKPLKIVIDAGNGMAEATFPHWLKELSVQTTFMYLEPDGSFPNHEANPLKVETLKDLQQKVREIGADFGFALDGDADRIGVVDEKGDVVGASYVIALVGAEVLRNAKPGSLMLYDLRSSKIVPEVWEQRGARTEMTTVGHANIKSRMKEAKAEFASELSLHLYYRAMGDLESSDLSLLYLLRILSREDRTLSELVAPLKKYAHSGEINFEVEDKESMVRAIKEAYQDQALRMNELDGIWIECDWGWFNVRLSNTEPVLRLNLEARDESIMREKVAELSAFIKAGKTRRLG